MNLRERCRIPLYEHQIVGVQKIINNPFFMLADEMGAGKSAQTIVAAQVLFNHGIIDTVVIIAPASVRAVWFDPDLGEIAKHFWTDTSGMVLEYHIKDRAWIYGDPKATNRLQFIVTNYDYIRRHAAEIAAYQSNPLP